MHIDTITTNQAAQMLGVSLRTVQMWIKKGVFPTAYKLHPGNPHNSAYRIPRADVDQVLRQRIPNPAN